MKTTKALLGAAVLSVGLLNLGSANAAIINIDSGNSSGIGVSLSAGDHVVSWIGTADGGAYDAWSAWSSGDNWLNMILVTTSAGQTGHGTGAAPWYSTPADALAAAQSATFHISLANAETVNFMVADYLFYDNRGGVSLSVTAAPVPVPAAAWLLGSGLLGLIGVARRKAI